MHSFYEQCEALLPHLEVYKSSFKRILSFAKLLPPSLPVGWVGGELLLKEENTSLDWGFSLNFERDSQAISRAFDLLPREIGQRTLWKDLIALVKKGCSEDFFKKNKINMGLEFDTSCCDSGLPDPNFWFARPKEFGHNIELIKVLHALTHPGDRIPQKNLAALNSCFEQSLRFGIAIRHVAFMSARHEKPMKICCQGESLNDINFLRRYVSDIGCMQYLEPLWDLLKKIEPSLAGVSLIYDIGAAGIFKIAVECTPKGTFLGERKAYWSEWLDIMYAEGIVSYAQMPALLQWIGAEERPSNAPNYFVTYFRDLLSMKFVCQNGEIAQSKIYFMAKPLSLSTSENLESS